MYLNFNRKLLSRDSFNLCPYNVLWLDKFVPLYTFSHFHSLSLFMLFTFYHVYFHFLLYKFTSLARATPVKSLSFYWLTENITSIYFHFLLVSLFITSFIFTLLSISKAFYCYPKQPNCHLGLFLGPNYHFPYFSTCLYVPRVINKN